jgi:hypothetical protein
VWDCPIGRFVEWAREAERIAEEIEDATPEG